VPAYIPSAAPALPFCGFSKFLGIVWGINFGTTTRGKFLLGRCLYSTFSFTHTARRRPRARETASKREHISVYHFLSFFLAAGGTK
jgi:hypothetical protein